MANRRITMNKVRELIRLHEESKLSNRKIARALNLSRPVIRQYLLDFKATALTYSAIKNMGDAELLEVLSNKKNTSDKNKEMTKYYEYLSRELKRTGVTLQILWKEYKRDHPDGYSYSRFCYHFQIWRSSSEVTMHIDHKAGDKMFVDFAGKRLSIIDRKTGEEKPVEVFVAILGGSQLTYVEAVKSQKKQDWITVNENALWYFGGVPKAICCDCLKSGVTNGDKYEPDINPEYSDFARHYKTVIVPARPGMPKDKALVENAVKLIYSSIYARLRNRVFFSIESLNEAIGLLLKEHNNKPFQKLKTSRRELFEEIERSELGTLPGQKYELKKFLNVKVQFNYHIEVREDRHYYSVPWRYKGKRVTVIYTERIVEVYHNNLRIAFHPRDRRPNRYSTIKEHMPSHHRFYDDWSPQRMIDWAVDLGDSVKGMVVKVLETRQYPEQGFKACLGILNLSKAYGKNRLDNACKRALEFNNYSYKAVKNILEKGLDTMQEELALQAPLPLHENIRGNTYYR